MLRRPFLGDFFFLFPRVVANLWPPLTRIGFLGGVRTSEKKSPRAVKKWVNKKTQAGGPEVFGKMFPFTGVFVGSWHL